MSRVKLAVVGPGLMGKKHIELILNRRDCLLAGIVAPDHIHNHQLAAKLNVSLFHDVDSLLTHVDVDGVIISSPNSFHAEQGTQCILARVPALIEKPITDTYDSAKRLVELAQSQVVQVLVGHHRAHSPILATAKKIIQGKKLGSVVAIMGSALFYKPADYFEAGPWRREVGGGPILINLIHEISNFRTLCGEIAAVQAIASTSTRNFTVEDTVAINFQFASGALGTFILSDTAASANSWEQTSQENKVYPAYLDEDCYLVTGTLGSLAIPTMRLKYYKNREEQSWWKPFEEETISFERLDPLECQLNNFVDVIMGRDLPLVSASEGLRNLEVIEAIRKSINQKALVYL